MIDRLRGWLRALFRPDAVEREMGEEMQYHLDRSIERLAARGMPVEEARFQARREFGNMTVLQEQAREARGVRLLTDLSADIRYSLRSLAHAPAFALSAVLILALGIGTVIGVYSAVHSVLLTHLPYPHDEQLVRVFQQNSPTNKWTLSIVDFQAIEQYGHSFSAVGVLRGSEVNVDAGRGAERLSAGYITTGFLKALDVSLAAGRSFTVADERPGATAVAILGNKYASHNFGSPREALGRAVTIDGVVNVVVGVLRPEDARLAGRFNDVWPAMRRSTPTRRGPFGLFVIARLKPGVPIDVARRDLDQISVRIFPQWQASFQGRDARLTPYSLRDVTIGNAERPLVLFSAAAAMVLLVAVADVASLGVVRSLRRSKEIALRSALGASSTRLVQFILAESIVLAFIGGAFGIGVGWATLALLQRFATGIPRLDTAHLDWSSIGMAAIVSLVAGVAIGIVPIVRLFARNGCEGLRDGTRAVGDSKHADRVRSAFVTAEFALALPVLSAGALLLASVMRLQAVNPGFYTKGLYSVRVGIPTSGYQDQAGLATFWKSVESGLAQRPGVTASGLGTALPPNDMGNSNNNFQLVDSPVPPGGAQPSVSWASVSSDFFAAMRVPLLDGRLFTQADTGGAHPVAIVTRAWARHYYANRSPIGHELISGGCVTCPHTVIIAVVGDMTFDGLGTPQEAVFSPLTEAWPQQLNVFVRAAGSQAIVAQRVQEVVHSANPLAAVGTMVSMDDAVYDSITTPRHWATIVLAFAAAAALMAAVGIFGLLSYTVAMRRREIGIRIALGAPSRHVIGWVIGGGMRFAGFGAILGLGLTALASRWLRASLYETSSLDPAMLICAVGGMLAVALIASWLPARQAATMDPVEAMRSE